MNLINQKMVRDLALAISTNERNGKFKRVSKEFLLEINENVRVVVTDRVKRHPSMGQTLKGSYGS